MLITGTGNFSLAPGVIFNEEKHTYFYKGKQHNGVTGKISKRLGLKYGSDSYMSEYCSNGSNIHKWISDWIVTGKFSTVHPDAVWIKSALEARYEGPEQFAALSEVLVTDGIGTSSAVDIMVRRPDGSYDIYDIKTGAVKPEYLAWQLGTYKYFIEKTGAKVNRCYCIASKDKMFYAIQPRQSGDIESMLYGK